MHVIRICSASFAEKDRADDEGEATQSYQHHWCDRRHRDDPLQFGIGPIVILGDEAQGGMLPVDSLRQVIQCGLARVLAGTATPVPGGCTRNVPQPHPRLFHRGQSLGELLVACGELPELLPRLGQLPLQLLLIFTARDALLLGRGCDGLTNVAYAASRSLKSSLLIPIRQSLPLGR